MGKNEKESLNFDMFTTLMLAVLAIYFGDFFKKIFPILKNIVYQLLLLGGDCVCINIIVTF